jgi:LSD1 subclass zinc finger protein
MVVMAILPNDEEPPAFNGITSVTDLQTGGEIRVQWGDARDYSQPLTFNIYYGEGDAFSGQVRTGISGSQYTVSGLANEKLYYFAVRAVDAYGNEDVNTMTFSIMASDGASPTFTGIGSVTDTQLGESVDLTWEAATDPSGPMTYNVYYGRNSAFTGNVVVGITGTSHRVTGLDDGVEYYFAVRAVDAFGNEDMNGLSLKGASSDHAAPTFNGVQFANNTYLGNQIKVTWYHAQDSSGGIVYTLYYGISSNPFSGGTQVTGISASSYMVEGLTNAQSYYFGVRAIDAYGNSDTNAISRKATPSDTSPPTFDGVISARDTGDGGAITITWGEADDRSKPISYNVYTSTSQNQPGNVTHTQGTYILMEDLGNGFTYYIMVRAVDAYGNEDQNERSIPVTPTDSTPPTFRGLKSVMDLTIGGKLRLTWEKGTDDSGSVTYNIYRSENYASTSTPEYTMVTSTEFEDYGLIDGRNYFYVVRAVDEYGNEDDNNINIDGTPTTANREPELTSPSVTFDDEGDADDSFIFRIIYTDPDDNQPNYVRLYIGEVPYEMSKTGSADYEDGVIYEYGPIGLDADQYLYYFECQDDIDDEPGISGDSGEDKTVANTLIVTEPKHAPEVLNPGYREVSDGTYEFYVMYSDEDNDEPNYVRLVVAGETFTLSSSSSGRDYAAGIQYKYTTNLEQGTTYTYYFQASDGDFVATTNARDISVPDEPDKPIWMQYIYDYYLILILLAIVLIAAARVGRGRTKRSNIINCPACRVQLMVPKGSGRVQCPNCSSIIGLRR